MDLPRNSKGPTKQPGLADLFREYLERTALSRLTGTVSSDAEGEVIPYEAMPAQPVDPRLAWDEATLVGSYFDMSAAKKTTPPSDWPELVSGHEPAAAVAMCFGNFPQLVRDVRSLIDAKNLSTLRCGPSGPFEVRGLEDWASRLTGDSATTLLKAGIMRLARDFDGASATLQQCGASASPAWQAALANELAALEWHRGREDRAIELWKSQVSSPPVLFNRGMAVLFQDRPVEARAYLTEAVAALPEDSGWHHLARLYATLAEMRP
jgi:hypothetical protein